MIYLLNYYSSPSLPPSLPTILNYLSPISSTIIQLPTQKEYGRRKETTVLSAERLSGKCLCKVNEIDSKSDLRTYFFFKSLNFKFPKATLSRKG